jgi:hypothetical protein
VPRVATRFNAFVHADIAAEFLADMKNTGTPSGKTKEPGDREPLKMVSPVDNVAAINVYAPPRIVAVGDIAVKRKFSSVLVMETQRKGG